MVQIVSSIRCNSLLKQKQSKEQSQSMDATDKLISPLSSSFISHRSFEGFGRSHWVWSKVQHLLNCGGVGSCKGGSVDGPYQQLWLKGWRWLTSPSQTSWGNIHDVDSMLTFFGGKHDENMKGRNEEGCSYKVRFEIFWLHGKVYAGWWFQSLLCSWLVNEDETVIDGSPDGPTLMYLECWLLF